MKEGGRAVFTCGPFVVRGARLGARVSAPGQPAGRGAQGRPAARRRQAHVGYLYQVARYLECTIS